MKRIAILSLIILLLGGCYNSSKESSIKESTISYAENIIPVNIRSDLFDMKADKKSNLYIADKEMIHVINQNGKETGIIKDKLKFCRNIALSDNSLFALDDTDNTIKKYTLKGEFIKEYPVTPAYCIKMEYFEDKIIMLNTGNNDNKKSSLTIYDLEDEKTNTLELDDLYSFTLYNKSILTAQWTIQGLLFHKYDLNLEEETENSSLEPTNSYNDIYYDTKNGQMLCIDANNLVLMDLEKNTSITIYSLSDSYFKKLAVSGDMSFIYDHNSKTIHKVDTISKNSNEYSLKLITCYDWLDHYSPFEVASEIMKREHPNFQVIYQQIDEMTYYTTFTTKLMAGDTDFDLFLCNDSEFYNYAINETYLDFSEYEPIVGSFSNMFEGIKQSCSYNDKVIGVPLNSLFEAWEINSELVEKTSVKMPEGKWTLDDFYELAKKCRIDLNNDGAPDTYIIEARKDIPIFISQFDIKNINLEDKKVDFNNEEFIGLMQLWKKLWDENLLLEKSFTGEKRDNVFLYESSLHVQSGDKELILPPVLNNCEVYPLPLGLLCINKNTRSKDLALEFIAAYMSKEAQTCAGSDGFYSDITAYKQPEPLPGIEYTFTINYCNEKNLNLMTHMWMNSKRCPDLKRFDVYRNNIVLQYVNNIISIEEAAKLIDEKAKMIVGE